MTASDLPGISRGARHAVVSLFVFSVLLATASLLFTSREVNQLRSAVLTQCQFDSDLGSAPITVDPRTGKASQLGVTLVADVRRSWYGLDCPGVISKPAPSFRHWAKVYHLPSR